MAGSLNRVTLIGNVGKDPEIRRTQSGSPVASFSVATSESWKDKASGEKKERTEWSNVVIWNEGLIGVVEKYVHKGSKVMVEGRMQTRKWQDKDGNDRYSTEVVLTGFGGQLILLGDPKGGGDRAPASSERPAGATNDMSDEVPF